MNLVLGAAQSECTAHGARQNYSWASVVFVVVGTATILLLAHKHRRHPGKRLHLAGRLLMASGWLGLALFYPVVLITGKDRCGSYHSPFVWVALSGALLLSFGLFLTWRATWAAIAFVAVVDFGMGLSIFGQMAAGNRKVGTAVVILVVHGVCTTVAAWWAWRLVGSGDPATRARASEAGRSLAAAWVVLAVFGFSSVPLGRDNPSLVLQDNAAISVFVIAAIGLIMGSGYTKYAEALASHRKELAAREPVPAASGVAVAPGPFLPALMVVLVAALLHRSARRSSNA